MPCGKYICLEYIVFTAVLFLFCVSSLSFPMGGIFNNSFHVSIYPAKGVAFFLLFLHCLISFLFPFLQSTFAMLNWALRETVTKAIFNVEMLPGPGFLTISYTILAIQYATSILFPSVWTAMSLTGATAAVFVAYILPGALIARVEGASTTSKVLGWTCVGLGILMGFVGVLNTLVLSKA